MSKEHENIEKAKRQLVIVGVVCVSAVVFVLWLLNLRSILASNNSRYASPLHSFKAAPGNLGSAWNDFRNQLENLRK